MKRGIVGLFLFSVLLMGCERGPDEVQTYDDEKTPSANPSGVNPHGVNPHGGNPHGGNPPGVNPQAKVDAGEGTTVKVSGLQSDVPADWIRKPAKGLRYAEFELPGDAGAATLVIFRGFGGSADANMNRWKGEILPASGTTIQIKDVDYGGLKGKRLDGVGTYKSAMGNPPQPQKDWQMIALHLEGDTIYHFKLTGPKSTIAKHLNGFNQWLEGFK